MKETATQLQMVTTAHAWKDSKDPTVTVSKHKAEEAHCFLDWQRKHHVEVMFAKQNLCFKYLLAGSSSYKKITLENHQPDTILVFSAQWPGFWMAVRLEVTLFWYRPHCFCCVNQVVMLTRCIYMTKAERSVSKQGHLQPRCHSKARSLSKQL